MKLVFPVVRIILGVIFILAGVLIVCVGFDMVGPLEPLLQDLGLEISQILRQVSLSWTIQIGVLLVGSALLVVGIVLIFPGSLRKKKPKAS